MTNLDFIANIVVQVPLVGVFIWFTLRLIAENRAERERQDDMQKAERIEARENSNTIIGEWRVYMAERDNQWRAFLEEERRARSEGMARLAEELKSQGATLISFSQSLTAHDALLRDLIDDRRGHP